jgi:ectoine hydroxylase-related dioxygenase (phytanoyl-CoA dioxygenase family)
LLESGARRPVRAHFCRKELAMNRSPLRPVAAEDVETYARDGAVCLRDVFDQDWVSLLLAAAKAHIQKLEQAANVGAGERLEWALGRARKEHKSPALKHLWHDIPSFREYILRSPCAEVTAQVLRSRTLNFFYDELFYKPAGIATPTNWHTDQPGWPVDGFMTPSVWMPLTPVDAESGLEVIAGSHKAYKPYWNMTNNSVKMVKPADRFDYPDCEAMRSDPSVRFLSWTMKPGDLLIVHPCALHASRGKPGSEARVALSTRWFGEDIRWNPRPECVNTRGVSFDEMIAGERPSGPFFPLVWSADQAQTPTARAS